MRNNNKGNSKITHLKLKKASSAYILTSTLQREKPRSIWNLFREA